MLRAALITFETQRVKSESSRLPSKIRKLPFLADKSRIASEVGVTYHGWT